MFLYILYIYRVKNLKYVSWGKKWKVDFEEIIVDFYEYDFIG